MGIGAWISKEEHKIVAFFKQEEADVVHFLTPLVKQILDAAQALGKETLSEGVAVILNAATKAATTAATATGDKVAVAEAAFLDVVKTDGVTVIHNAEAGAIKAAVAVLQTAKSDPSVVAVVPTVPTPVVV